MQLQRLLENVDARWKGGVQDLAIAGVAYDSRRVQPGYLFVALRGMKTDGNLFVGQALQNGAVAVVSEDFATPVGDAAWIQVADGRKALAEIAANYYGHPCKKLRLIGITGTNGKTSTAFILDAILRTAGIKTGLVTTIEYRGPQGGVAAERTTPESLDLQALLARFLEQGCRYVVMEVSSHALALRRVHTCQFRSAIFTNLTSDHLDYHRTQEEYFDAKRQLFIGTGSEPPRKAIINLDDSRGKILLGDNPGRCITYSLKAPADFQVIEFEQQANGLQIHLQTPLGFFGLSTSLQGKPNVSNILAAVAAAHDLGVDWDVIRRGIEQCSPIPGRFQAVECGQAFRVIVDYAHTEDALEKLLLVVREMKPKRILLLFGCGGDRDRGKRVAMGVVAERLSDVAVITSDNPRSEDPLAIIEEIRKGFRQKLTQPITEPDRQRAIRQILEMATPGDAVVLAGKGHETYQVLADKTIHFDDREVVRSVMKEMGYQS